MKTGLISDAKLTKPRLQKKVLFRQRLFRLLDEIRGHPAIWVCGPGGSGKTTLAATYLEQNHLPCLWYQIDEGDSDIATFFYYLSLAAKQIDPQKAALPLLTAEYALGLSAFTRRFFGELFDRLGKPGVLVLDNYQEVLPDCLLHGVLRDALPVIPEHVNVFILSRSRPPAILARALADNILHEIGWKDLRLQLPETRDLIYLLEPKACQQNLPDTLYEKTDGWIAGLILLLKRAGTEDIRTASFSQLSGDTVFDYFATEILEAADPEIRDFLLQTAFLPAMTPQMAESLTGAAHAGRILSQMSRNHWFTDRRSAGETTYQYHPMFREFLLNTASRTYSPDFLSRLKEKSAALLAKNGQEEAAVGLLLESGNLEKAVCLILSCAQTMVLQGRIQTLGQWLDGFQPEWFEKAPWLIYWQAVCRMYVKPDEGKKLFENALALFEGRADTAGIFLCLCGVLHSITYSAGSFKLFDHWIQRLQAYSKDFKMLPSDEVKGKVVSSMLYALTLRRPEHPEYKLWENRGVKILESGVIADIKIQVVLPLVIHRLFSGNMAEAAHFIGFYRELAQPPDVTPLALLTLKDLETFCYWLDGRFDQCRSVAAEALELASSTGIHIISPYLLGHAAAGALSTGSMDEAAGFVGRIEKFVVQAVGWTRELYHTLVLWQALLEKDLPRAMLHAKKTLEYAEKTGCPSSASFDHLGMALALHASGKSKEAARHLSRAFSICKRTGSRQTEFACHLAGAEMALDAGDEGAAAKALKKAMAIARAGKYVNTWFWRPEAMTRLCCKALEAGIETAYVQYLIRRRNLVPDEPPLDQANWPWPVKIYTLGEFAILKEDQPLGFCVKTREKPIFLLKAILSLGSREVGEDTIADLLWPEADGDMAHGNFKTTLHRLRKLLGSRKAIETSSGRITLNRKFFWVDAWAFEHLLLQADKAWHSAGSEKERQRAAVLTQKALSLYHGPFLASDDHVLALREHLHHRFLTAVKNLGAYLEDKRQWEQAIDTYETGLKADAAAELCYQRLMVCYHRLGRKEKVLSVYHRCRKALQVSLGLLPSPATEALLKNLHSTRK